eukprot:266963-Rhodomonas_salina.1
MVRGGQEQCQGRMKGQPRGRGEAVRSMGEGGGGVTGKGEGSGRGRGAGERGVWSTAMFGIF